MDVHGDLVYKVVRHALVLQTGCRTRCFRLSKRIAFKAAFGECEFYLQHRADKERKAGNRAVIDDCGDLVVKSRRGKLLYELHIADVA